MHVSDSHIDAGPEPGRETEAEFMRGVNSQGLPDVNAVGALSSAVAKLQTQLQAGASAGAQLIVHTGDLVNFPSPKAVAQVRAHSKALPFLPSPVICRHLSYTD